MTQTVESIDFGSLEVIEIPITLGGQKYVLCEADGNAGCAYRNALIRSADMTIDISAGKKGAEQKQTGKIRDLANVEPLLVSMTLFKIESDGKRSRVSEATVRSWPARVVTKLYNKAKEISELDEAFDNDEDPTPADALGNTEDASS